MFTILEVRDELRSYTDPSWFDKPAGTLASAAEPGDLRRDGIDLAKLPAAISLASQAKLSFCADCAHPTYLAQPSRILFAVARADPE
jgi:hypothetical protein